MTTFKNVLATIFLITTGAYAVLVFTALPNRDSAAIVTAGQAAACALIYALILITNNSRRIGRFFSIIRRQEPRQIAAQLVLWSVAIAALIYSAVTA